MNLPAIGVKCVDCGCCQATIFGNAAERKEPLCWECDAGEPCKGKTAKSKQQAADSEKAGGDEPAELAVEAAEEEIPMHVKSQGKQGKRITDEQIAAILAYPLETTNAQIAKEVGVSDVSAAKIRRDAGVTKGKPPAKRKTQVVPRERQAVELLATDVRQVENLCAHFHEQFGQEIASHSVTPPAPPETVKMAVEIDEPRLDAYWSRLSLEQKAAVIEMQMEALLGR